MRMIEVCKLLRKPENVGNWKGRAIIMIMRSARDKRSKPIHPDTNLVFESVRHARDIFIKWMGYVIVENNKCCARTRQEQDKNKHKMRKEKIQKVRSEQKAQQTEKTARSERRIKTGWAFTAGCQLDTLDTLYTLHTLHTRDAYRKAAPHRAAAHSPHLPLVQQFAIRCVLTFHFSCDVPTVWIVCLSVCLRRLYCQKCLCRSKTTSFFSELLIYELWL